MNDNIFLSLGSNLGNKALNLTQAVKALQIAGEISQKSSIYRTDAWGNTKQPSFYNQVIKMSTALAPQDLLTKILSIELNLGRIREEKWGPRTIDIDLLFFNNAIITSHDLTIPHPGIASRRFVLEPLNEIDADFIHPVLKQTIHSLLDSCPDLLKVERVN